MQDTRLFDEKIKKTLSGISNQIQASDQLKEKIYYDLHYTTTKEKSSMKKHFTLKSMAILAAVICVATATVFAAGHMGYISYSSSSPTYKSFPKTETLEKDLGFVPDAVDSFSNGYTFKDAVIGSTSPVDENGKKMGDYKFIRYSYLSEKGQEVSLTVNKVMPGEEDSKKADVTTYEGIDLSYLSQNYRFVPADYKLTDDDKKLEQSGDVVFSYGSDKVENSVIKSLSWTDNGFSYILMATNSSLAKDDFNSMAEQIIDFDK